MTFWLPAHVVSDVTATHSTPSNTQNNREKDAVRTHDNITQDCEGMPAVKRVTSTGRLNSQFPFA